MRSLYVRLYLDILDNPKLAGANGNAKWLYVAGFIVSARTLGDGHLRPAVALAEADVPAGTVKTLTGRGLWHKPGHDCDRCPQPLPTYVVIHDYLDHQESKEKIEAAKAAKSAAGKKGAASRWHSTSHGSRDSMSHDRDGGKPMAYLDVEVDPLVTSVSQVTPIGLGRLTDLDIEKIRTRLGATSPSHARKVALEVLTRADSDVRQPLRYVLKAIDAEPDRYRPTPGPVRKSDECPGHPGQPAAHCGGCRADMLAGDHR